MYVYQITNNINGKIYIGITNNYKKRWSNEISKISNSKRQQVITNAIQKYGKENFTFEILYSGLTPEEASEKEIELIKEKKSLIPNGYNVAKGGMYNIANTPRLGADNGNACLTYEEAKFIKDNRNIPAYLLYEDYANIITYDAFLKCYNHITYKNIEPTVDPYPFNREFSCQFTSSKLDYEDVVELRKSFEKGIYWKDVYENYKEIFSNEWSFWQIYYGKKFKLIMPEVFTKENYHKHSSLKNSGENNGKAKLRKEDVIEIRKLHSQGIKNSEIYKLYPQVTPTTIRAVINNKTWKNLL